MKVPTGSRSPGSELYFQTIDGTGKTIDSGVVRSREVGQTN